MIDRIRVPEGDVDLWIELGSTHVACSQAAALGPGSVVSLDALVDEPVNIFVAGRLVARGEVLELDGNYCIRVTELVGASKAG